MLPPAVESFPCATEPPEWLSPFGLGRSHRSTSTRWPSRALPSWCAPLPVSYRPDVPHPESTRQLFTPQRPPRSKPDQGCLHIFRSARCCTTSPVLNICKTCTRQREGDSRHGRRGCRTPSGAVRHGSREDGLSCFKSLDRRGCRTLARGSNSTAWLPRQPGSVS